MSSWHTNQTITDIKYDKSWKSFFTEEFEKDYIIVLEKFLENEIKTYGEIREIYPPRELVFNAFNICPMDQLKVVIIGQDPYINPGEAMGLCFSVPENIKLPPSLRNIYEEMKQDENLDFDYFGAGSVVVVVAVEAGGNGNHEEKARRAISS